MATSVPQQIAALDARIKQNEEVIRFLLSLLHPAPIHEDAPPPPSADAWHVALMAWLDKYGGRVSPPEPTGG